MIADPPVDAGEVHETVTCVLAATVVTLRGLVGTVNGVALTSAEADPVPTALIARKRNL
ncbi:unannotated protein [freshwater metagenome]|uniref:Unannotated protein n=1 Tax=freshwater metagenome TaxID=449393 RepID=A0A6J6LKB5_9ZZZZ